MAKRKHKLELRERKEFRDFSSRIAKGHVEDVHLLDTEVMAEAMEGADWSDDPGTGKAVILQDGRELLNPLPVAPPSSILAAAAEPSVNDLVERALKRHFDQLKANDEIDTLADMDDFGEDEEFTPFSQFEVVLRDEAPAIPADVEPEAVEEVKKAEAELAPPPPPPAVT